MNHIDHSCPITDEPVDDVILKMGDTVEYVCPTCGRFRITFEAATALKVQPRWKRWAKFEKAVAIAQKYQTIPFVSSR